MVSRLNKPDTDADRQMKECLDGTTPTSFVMVSGAGSGKTTSLIKALNHLIERRGVDLRRRSQQVACITYTENARNEIWADVRESPLVHVSTIHSFLWTLASPFQKDWRRWVSARIDKRIEEHRATLAKPRTRESTKLAAAEKIVSLSAAKETLPRGFRYGIGSDYANGVLGHDDIISAVPELLVNSPLFQTLVAQRHPFILVDESQDTQPQVVDALKAVVAKTPMVCLGFFGDPLQRIYTTGVGAIPIPPTWKLIEKAENFRCPDPVLRVINRLRTEAGGHPQILAGAERSGSAHILIIPHTDEEVALTRARRWIARKNNDPVWLTDGPEADLRVLVLVHRMAAKRLGFQQLYRALNDDAPIAIKDAFQEGSAWPVKPLLKFLVPLVIAHRREQRFLTMQLLRTHCPLLGSELPNNGPGVAQVLARLSTEVQWLAGALEAGAAASIRDVLSRCQTSRLTILDERLASYLEPQEAEESIGEDDEQRQEAECVRRVLACNATEVVGYHRYIEGESPFATQQSIKGAEFSRVITIVDEEDRVHPQFSYAKLFKNIELSPTDRRHIEAGEDSVLNRTQRLFYVSCSRSLKDLVIVMLSHDVVASRERLLADRIVPEMDLHVLDRDME